MEKKLRKPLTCCFGLHDWFTWSEREDEDSPSVPVCRECTGCGRADVWIGNHWVEDPAQRYQQPALKNTLKIMAEMAQYQRAEREAKQKELADQKVAKAKLDALGPWLKRQIANASRNRNRNLRLYAPDEDKPHDYGDPDYLAKYKYWEGVADGLKKTQAFLSQDDIQPPPSK